MKGFGSLLIYNAYIYKVHMYTTTQNYTIQK